MIPSDPDERDLLAGEYVLGALDEAQLRAVEREIDRDPAFAAAVLAWERRLLPAAEAAVPAAGPDPGLWLRIRAGLSAAEAPGTRRTTLWRSAPLWRATTGLATAAALLLAVFPVRDRAGPEGAPRFFAILQARDSAGQETGPGWVIRIAEDGTVRSEPLGRVAPDAAHALQLWTLWDPGRGPVSLGVLPPGGAVRLPAERLPTIGGGQLFEITLEPPAGSPTGRPTGRVLFIGRAAPAMSQNL